MAKIVAKKSLFPSKALLQFIDVISYLPKEAQVGLIANALETNRHVLKQALIRFVAAVHHIPADIKNDIIDTLQRSSVYIPNNTQGKKNLSSWLQLLLHPELITDTHNEKLYTQFIKDHGIVDFRLKPSATARFR